jgi:hypothetical protein
VRRQVNSQRHDRVGKNRHAGQRNRIEARFMGENRILARRERTKPKFPRSSVFV